MQVATEEAARLVSQPKYDFTSKGVRTLDLGFGARAPASKPGGITWDQLKKVITLFP